MTNQKESSSIMVEIVYPSDQRRILLVPTIGSEALKAVLKDIERMQQALPADLWFWPGKSEISATKLFALSTAMSPEVRNEMILKPDEDLEDRRICSTSKSFTIGHEQVLQLYLIVRFYPRNPYKFSALVSALILQQLVWDILNYEYILRIQYGPEEQRLEKYLIDNCDCIFELDEMCDQAVQLLADVSEHGFYGFQYFPVYQKNQNDTVDYLIGIGMAGLMFCQSQLQKTVPCTLPMPFLIRFEEIDELGFLPCPEGEALVTLSLKRGNPANKKRIVIAFASKERLQRFIEELEAVNSLNDSVHAGSHQTSESGMEFIPSSNVRMIAPKKVKKYFTKK